MTSEPRPESQPEERTGTGRGAQDTPADSGHSDAETQADRNKEDESPS